jgi:NtrC-family two-component system response regulator AlgB
MRELSTGLVSHMKIHSWPGNLRELRNSLQRAVILAKTDEIAEADLDLQTEGELYPEAGDRIPLKNVRESYVRKVLSRTGSIAAAAKVLKIDKATFYRMQKQWNREPALLEAVNC